MTEQTPAIYALYGNPVGHSLSPPMHNAAYKKMGINASYCSYCVERPQEVIERIKERSIQGASVTIPFKTAVIPYLDEIEDDARAIGAVNTILHDDTGKLRGYNTDWIGIVLSLEESLEIQNKTFAILGAGGAARAAAFGILKKGGIPLILNRSTTRGEELAQEFGCPFYPLSEIGAIRADCLINTTPVGMAQEKRASPIAKEALINFRWVMDCIYNPLKTQLLLDAEGAGCTPIDGVGMFVHQGAEQIKIWMGKEPPREFMRQVVLEELGAQDGD
ncbi:MAG: shikimate dehydrogenase [Deltaproteobacteria bacterium]|nr:shikimate dehydrogenase [Deltaproteobacteria bacterium]